MEMTLIFLSISISIEFGYKDLQYFPFLLTIEVHILRGKTLLVTI